jgi:carbamoyl-phosphate synthase small subunit
MKKGFLVLESGEIFEGEWISGPDKAGEVVFNTSHSGFEEMATDPSYFSQILVCTAPQQGNYGAERAVWESDKVHIHGFIALEIQNSVRERSWIQILEKNNVPIIHKIDTRKLTMSLRKGTQWGALVQAASKEEALQKTDALIAKAKNIDTDWAFLVSRKQKEIKKGQRKNGIKIAMIDYGVKENILRETLALVEEVCIFPSRATSKEILDYKPTGIMLSNGPGDPALVEKSVDTIKSLLGAKPIFGICMGHQLLALALGGKTYKLKFGHRGANHPIKDNIAQKIYMTSQNHGYAVDSKSLNLDIAITHLNLYDNTVAGIESKKWNALSVQFHPENSPGPRDASYLFEHFVKSLSEQRTNGQGVKI